MDFWNTIGVLLRRWYVALPVLLASLGIAGAVFVVLPTQYESTGTIVLTMPKAGANVTTDKTKQSGLINPLLGFDGSLVITSQLLIQTLNDPAVAKQIADAGGTAGYKTGNGGLDGPFVVVVADGNSRDAAQRTVELAFAHVTKDLTDRQQRIGAPDTTFIVIEPVVPPTAAQAKISGKARYAGAAGALGIAASLCSAFMIESYLQRRRRREVPAGSNGYNHGTRPAAAPPARPQQAPAHQQPPRRGSAPAQHPSLPPSPHPALLHGPTQQGRPMPVEGPPTVRIAQQGSHSGQDSQQESDPAGRA